jgi:glyoxylase-like metal-dependent hydrolase (beta-lactamase superfamily II)
MTFARTTIGHVELFALLDGFREQDGTVDDFFPDVPSGALAEAEAVTPGLIGPAGGWNLRVRAWVIRHVDRSILVDTGIGPSSAPAPAWFGAPGELPTALAEAGISPNSIETVAISHVHDDHIGGTVTPEGSPAFPNARYLIRELDWSWQERLAREALEARDARAQQDPEDEPTEDDEDEVIFETLLRPLADAGVLDLIKGGDDHEIADGIVLHHAPGHTPGHQVVRIRSARDRALLSADTFNHPSQLGRPDWPSGPDAHHAQAAATRRAILADLFSHPGTVVAPTHFAEAFGRVVSGHDGLAAWRPLA